MILGHFSYIFFGFIIIFLFYFVMRLSSSLVFEMLMFHNFYGLPMCDKLRVIVYKSGYKFEWKLFL